MTYRIVNYIEGPTATAKKQENDGCFNSTVGPRRYPWTTVVPALDPENQWSTKALNSLSPLRTYQPADPARENKQELTGEKHRPLWLRLTII